jgi:aspartate dehydrogenase
MIGSPTAFADEEVENRIKAACLSPEAHAVYIPSGALWGAIDIQKMADRNTLKGLKITMKKSPESLKVLGDLKDKLDAFIASNSAEEFTLYEGPCRHLCPLAPNNVNTMAAASIAAHNLGFDKVVASLVAVPGLEAHIIDIEVTGPAPSEG